jgi:cytochrome c-type biogenesis protein
VLGAVLTYAAGSGSPAHGALLLGTYAAGLAAPFLAVAAAAPRALALLERAKPHLRAVERATGALLVAAGALLAADRLSWLVPSAGPAARGDLAAAPAPVAAPTASALPLSADSAQGATCATPSNGPFPAGTDGAACATPALPFAPSAAAPAAGLEAALAAAAAARPSVVEVVSASCPVCERMAPVVAEAKRRCAGRHLAIETRSVESAEGAALARRHAVRGVPTFLLLDPSGGEVGRLVGEQPLAALERAMLDLTGGRCGS